VHYCENVLKRIIARYSPYFRQQYHSPTGLGTNASMMSHHLHSHDVPEFIEPKKCSPSSPDLNPVILLWGALQQKLYRQKIRDAISS